MWSLCARNRLDCSVIDCDHARGLVLRGGSGIGLCDGGWVTDGRSWQLLLYSDRSSWRQGFFNNRALRPHLIGRFAICECELTQTDLVVAVH
jgi:hypothetical protein